jgi:hypothetical protein
VEAKVWNNQRIASAWFLRVYIEEESVILNIFFFIFLILYSISIIANYI